MTPSGLGARGGPEKPAEFTSQKLGLATGAIQEPEQVTISQVSPVR